MTAGTYTVTVTDVSTGCPATRSISISQSSALVTVNQQSICSGSSYSIGSSVYNSSGVYHDTLTSSNGCDSVVVTTLSVTQLLTVSANPSGPVDICSGKSVLLSASVQSSNYSYSWSDANGNIIGTTARVSVSTSGVYSVSVTTSSGCVTTSTNSVVVNVISLPAPSVLSTTKIALTYARMNWVAVAG